MNCNTFMVEEFDDNWASKLANWTTSLACQPRRVWEVANKYQEVALRRPTKGQQALNC
ncbi:hypothetical protein L0F63_000311 [Massospora cicadina]|nr:hypothetical protein L0F63_000311 [Massospora cicadina]